jgi:molecular chaperone IbpA
MRTYDFAPLFRSTIGFDRLFDLAETAQRGSEEGYPPYNIERLAEDRYQITLAVAGFSPDEISITAKQNVVTIEGGKAKKAERELLYRGISTATSNGSSTWPTTSRSRTRPSTTAC